MREIVVPAGLAATTTDALSDSDVPVARGHTGLLPLGFRAVIPADNKTFAYAPVTGFTSTACELARFFAQLAPNATKSVLAPDSRREMVRAHWPDRDSALDLSFGLGVVSGNLGGWDYFGNIGLFQGFVSRSAVFLPVDVTITVLMNTIDGPVHAWLEGIVHILQRFHAGGAPKSEFLDWAGRWWSPFGPLDLVPFEKRVLVSNPAAFPPFFEASEIELIDADHGVITRAPAAGRFGEAAWRVRNAQGTVTAIRIGDSSFVSEEDVKSLILRKYAVPQ